MIQANDQAIQLSIHGMKRELDKRLEVIRWKLIETERAMHLPREKSDLLTMLTVEITKAHNLKQCIVDLEARYTSNKLAVSHNLIF